MSLEEIWKDVEMSLEEIWNNEKISLEEIWYSMNNFMLLLVKKP